NHGLARDCRVTPQFIRKIENIGKEIWNMNKRFLFTEDNSRPMLTLGNSIVPMLHPAPRCENSVRIICNVTRRVDTCMASFQIFVHDDAVLYGDASLLG